MYIITTSASSINIKHGMDNFTFYKEDIGGIHQRGHIVHLAGSNNAQLYEIDFTEGVTIDGVVQTTIGMLITTMTGDISIGVVQVFIATAGQTSFPTVFTATTTTKVYRNGYRDISSWTIVAGVVTFTIPVALGEEIIIENI